MKRTGGSEKEYLAALDFGHFNFGLQWDVTSNVKLGATINNAIPWYKRKFSEKNGEHVVSEAVFVVPIKYSFGVSIIKNRNRLHLDTEILAGRYGGRSVKRMTFWFIRAGYERNITDKLTGRCGVMIPLVMKTTTQGDISIPAPGLNGSLGIGYTGKKISLDLAVYGDPGLSYVRHEAVIGLMLSGSFYLK